MIMLGLCVCETQVLIFVDFVGLKVFEVGTKKFVYGSVSLRICEK